MGIAAACRRVLELNRSLPNEKDKKERLELNRSLPNEKETKELQGERDQLLDGFDALLPSSPTDESHQPGFAFVRIEKKNWAPRTPWVGRRTGKPGPIAALCFDAEGRGVLVAVLAATPTGSTRPELDEIRKASQDMRRVAGELPAGFSDGRSALTHEQNATRAIHDAIVTWRWFKTDELSDEKLLQSFRVALGVLAAAPAAAPAAERPLAPAPLENSEVVPDRKALDLLHEILRGVLGGGVVLPHAVIFEGVPGTGKTFALQKFREKVARDLSAAHPSAALGGNGSAEFAMTMHPATAYEDFVEGWRPTRSGQFEVQDGFFVSVCKKARASPTQAFVVLLDELNRCNIPKVMGDLLTTVERSKRATWSEGDWDVSRAQVVTLPYSKERFFVPDNVFVIGTMNTTDRSVAPMDAALRRRFAFHRVWPLGFDPEERMNPQKIVDENVELRPVLGSVTAWHRINETLQASGNDAMLGHSYLFDLAADLKRLRDLKELPSAADKVVAHHWNHHIFPQLVDSLVSNDLLDEVWAKLEFEEDQFGALRVVRERLGKGLMGLPTLRLQLPKAT